MAAPAAAAPSPAEVRRAMGEAMGGAYQQKLPGDLEPGQPGADVDRSRRQRPQAAPRPRRNLQRQTGTSAIASWILWALVIVAAVIIAMFLARELGDYHAGGGAGAEDDDEPAREVDEAVVQRPLGDAEALATRGRFGEAIHALLLRTLEELTRKAGVHLPESLTSREILGRVALPHDARIALQGLVLAVEITHFGGNEPGEADYARCREHFRRFAAAYTRGMTA